MSEDTNQMPPRIEAWTEPFGRSMTFTCVAGADKHWASTCDWVPSLPGSAEYVRADIAERLLTALKRIAACSEFAREDCRPPDYVLSAIAAAEPVTTPTPRTEKA